MRCLSTCAWYTDGLCRAMPDEMRTFCGRINVICTLATEHAVNLNKNKGRIL